MKKTLISGVVFALLTGCNYLSYLRKQSLTLDAPASMELVVYRQVGQSGQRVMSPVGLIRGGQTIELEEGDYLVANECSGYEFKQTKDRPTKIPVRRLNLTLHGEQALNSASEQTSGMQESGRPDPSSGEAESLPSDEAPHATEARGETTKSDSVKENTQTKLNAEALPTPRSDKPPEAKGVVHTMCIDPLDQQRNQWTQRREFDILPGTTEMRVGGRLVKLENHGETSEPISLDLYPVLVSSEFPSIHARFYLTPEEKDSKAEVSVVGIEANSTTWLLPGNYALEVNGTRRKMSVEKGSRTEMTVGVLRIEMPDHFPIEERLKAGGQPVFVYLDTGALLNLNTGYLVFPGSYNVSIEGSEVQDVFQVESGKETVIRTFAARVDVPACPDAEKGCRSAPRITIHREQKPYALMTVEPRLPFLLLEGNYEYGVEGLRGIKRSLNKRSGVLAGEPLARVRFKWDVRPAQGRYRTDLVRIESRGQNTFGRSLDLLFHKPDEVYVPAGNYDLTYFVGDPLAERSKSRQSLLLEAGQTREAVIPIYVERATRADDGRSVSAQEASPARAAGKNKKAAADLEETSTPATLPRSLTPLRR
jgi:hypothetical protein